MISETCHDRRAVEQAMAQAVDELGVVPGRRRRFHSSIAAEGERERQRQRLWFRVEEDASRAMPLLPIVSQRGATIL